MASNPFGITQVDIPGLIGMHQQLRRQRLEELYTAKKMEREDREFQREEKKAGVIAKLFGAAPTPTTPGINPNEPGYQPVPVTEAPRYDAGQGGPVEQFTPQQLAATRQALGPERYEAWRVKNGIGENGSLSPQEMTPEAMPETAIPQQLPPPPPRNDGVQINPEALQELFTIDPEMAMKFQEAAGKLDKVKLEQIAVHGENKAKAATYLLRFPKGPERTAAFQRIAPELLTMGFTQDDLRAADLSDEMLTKDRVMGMGLKDIISQENADRTFNATQAERDADNARADRADRRAERADQRSGVRFKERALDRAAIAASGGIRTDTTDLNY